MRALLVLVVLAGCAPRRYFKVPPTEAGSWCLNYCVAEQVRCRDGLGPTPRAECQKHADRCIGDCPGAIEVSYEEWVREDHDAGV